MAVGGIVLGWVFGKAADRGPAENTRIQRQITTTDNQIDKLVYELYDLAPAEIAIVERSEK